MRTAAASHPELHLARVTEIPGSMAEYPDRRLPDEELSASAQRHATRRASIAANPVVTESYRRNRHQTIFEKILHGFKRVAVTPTQSRRGSISTQKPEVRSSAATLHAKEESTKEPKKAKKKEKLPGHRSEKGITKVRSWVRSMVEDAADAMHRDSSKTLREEALTRVENRSRGSLRKMRKSTSSLKDSISRTSSKLKLRASASFNSIRAKTSTPSQKKKPAHESLVAQLAAIRSAQVLSEHSQRTESERLETHSDSMSDDLSRIAPTLAIPVLEALGFGMPANLTPTSSDLSFEATLDYPGMMSPTIHASEKVPTSFSEPDVEDSEADTERSADFLSALVAPSRPATPSSTCIGKSKSFLLLDPVRTLDTLKPIAVQPESSKLKRKSKSKRHGSGAESPATVGSIDSSLTNSSRSTTSFSSLSSKPEEKEESRFFGSGTLRRLPRSVGSHLFGRGSGTSLNSSRVRVSASAASLSHTITEERSFSIELSGGHRSPTRSASRSIDPSPVTSLSRPSRGRSGTTESGWSFLPRAFSHSSRQRFSDDDVETRSCKSTATSYTQQASSSLPAHLPDATGDHGSSHLNNMRSRSMDFQHKKRSSTSSQRSAQSHKKIVETSTIFSSLSPSCLVSPQGVPEQSEGKINQYHILRDIGSGAYGRVVLCRSEHDQRYYACKIVSKNRLRKKLMWSAMAPPGAGPCQSPGCPNGYMEAIKREIAILKKLSKHPNINNLVEVLDDEKEDSLYMIFELCEYGPIMHLPVRGSVRPMEEPVARQYFRDAVLGLEYLHYKRIIHRDIKPENLLRRASLDSQLGIVQIADFGISTMFEDEVDDPVLDDKNASPLFTAPEACQCDVQHVRGYPLDIWALGVTLYSMVHGRTPWQEESIVLLYDKILNAPAMIGEHLTPPLQDLLQQMLMKDPDERITLSAIKEHPWVTCNGEDPMLPTNENCVFEEVTEEEVQNAFKPAMVFVTKIINRLKGKKNTSRHASAPTTPTKEELPASSPFGPKTTGASRSGIQTPNGAHTSIRTSVSLDTFGRAVSTSPRREYIPNHRPVAHRTRSYDDHSHSSQSVSSQSESSTSLSSNESVPAHPRPMFRIRIPSFVEGKEARPLPGSPLKEHFPIWEAQEEH